MLTQCIAQGDCLALRHAVKVDTNPTSLVSLECSFEYHDFLI